MSKPMTLERFEELVAAYGAQSALWPSQERAAMAQVLAESADADAILARAARLTRCWTPACRQPMRSYKRLFCAICMPHWMPEMMTLSPFHNRHRGRHAWSGQWRQPLPHVLSAALLSARFWSKHIGDGDLMVSFDIISDAFLPTEPL